MSLLLREQPWQVRCLLARSRRLAAGLPTVWEAFARGELDAEQVRVIDRVARRVSEAGTLAVIDERVVDAAQTQNPKRLAVWLLRLVVAIEPLAFEERHRAALAERGVRIVQGADGIGYVTGGVAAADAAAIDGVLAAAARSLGAEDPRTDQQRRADCFVDLLLGALGDDQANPEPTSADDDPGSDEPDDDASDEDDRWVEVEQIDPDTGELLDTRWQQVDDAGEPVGEPVARPDRDGEPPPAWLRRPRPPLRIGIVVPLSSLLGLDDSPAQLADRSALVPAEELRRRIADTVGPDGPGRDGVLFTRLLTDDGGRLLDATELGRYPSRRLAEAVRVRAGTCRFPTCTVPANRSDLDHHDPWPEGRTSAANLDPLCRRHHRAKTFAWLASVRDGDEVTWTLPDAHRYRCADEPLPTGAVA